MATKRTTRSKTAQKVDRTFCSGCAYEEIHRCLVCGQFVCRPYDMEKPRGLGGGSACLTVGHFNYKDSVFCVGCWRKRPGK
jgi:hypothetical protein